MSKVITEKEFKKEVLGSKEKVLVDFYADWCGPCKMLGPIMDDISKKHPIFKINVDNEENLAREYGIMSIPCVICFQNGEELERLVGFHSKSEILELLK